MPKYLIHIGDRELEIESPSLPEAMDTAMSRYPGALVTGWALLRSEGEEAAESPEDGSEEHSEGEWGFDDE